MTVNCSPFGPLPQFELSSGQPAVGNQLFFYVAGSVNTKQNTYTDSTGLVANSNPLVLNALGQPANQIWFTAGAGYKVVFAPAGDTDPPSSPIWTIDNLRGINDTTTTSTEWLSGPAPTFIGATSFSIVGDQRTTFQINRRLLTTNTSGTIYSSITNSTYDGSKTTVTVTNDSGSLDSGLSAVSYALLNSTNPSVPAQYAKSNIAASFTTLALSSVSGGVISAPNGTTGSLFGTFTNTGLTLAWGIESSVGASIFSNTSAYAMVLGSQSAGAIQLVTGNSVRATLNATGLNLPSGAVYQINGVTQGITLGTPTVTTSGTAINITGIPTTAKRVTVNFKGVSTNGSANLLLQIGPAGGVETSGYSSRATEISSTGTNSSAGFILTSTGEIASSTIHGSFVLALENSAAFSWCGTGLLTDFANSIQHSAAGSKSTASAITQLTLTTVGGTDTFDAGEINVIVEI